MGACGGGQAPELVSGVGLEVQVALEGSFPPQPTALPPGRARKGGLCNKPLKSEWIEDVIHTSMQLELIKKTVGDM